MPNIKLTKGELIKIEHGEKIDKDYFYVLVISHHSQEPGEEYWYTIYYDNKDFPDGILAYASKCSAGLKLSEAIRHDLDNDFQYPNDKGFEVEEIINFDTAQNKQGDTLTRLAVHIVVDEMFDPSQSHPIGMTAQWQLTGYDMDRFNREWEETVGLVKAGQLGDKS